jgi:hypothetical protein
LKTVAIGVLKFSLTLAVSSAITLLVATLFREALVRGN